MPLPPSRPGKRNQRLPTIKERSLSVVSQDFLVSSVGLSHHRLPEPVKALHVLLYRHRLRHRSPCHLPNTLKANR
jgi:hypothetical protein